MSYFWELVPTKSSPVEIRTFPCIGSRIYLLVNSDQAVCTIVPLCLQMTFSGLFCSWCTCYILVNQMGTNFQNPLVQVGQTSPLRMFEPGCPSCLQDVDVGEDIFTPTLNYPTTSPPPPSCPTTPPPPPPACLHLPGIPGIALSSSYLSILPGHVCAHSQASCLSFQDDRAHLEQLSPSLIDQSRVSQF